MHVPLSTGHADLDRGLAWIDGQEVRLTPNESKLLAYLVERAGHTVSGEELLTEVFGYSATVRSRTVVSTMQRLRKKVEADPANPVHLHNVYARGYRFEPCGEPEGMLGRSEELATLRRRLREGRLWLVGPGGFGKSTLAQHYAQRAGGHPLLVALTDVTSVPELLAAFARALGLERLADVDSLVSALTERAPTLLLLDAAEGLGSELVPVLDQLERIGPTLITSRMPCAGESTMELAPLPEAAAERLFRRGLPHAIDPARFADLLARLHGIPLAIELASARLKVFSPEELGRHVDDLGILLAGGEGRHASMDGVLQWSWDRTPEVLRAGLRALLPGWLGLAVEDAVRLVGGDALTVLGDLKTWGWVRQHEDRIVLLDPVRQFLEKVVDVAPARSAHRQLFLERARVEADRILAGRATPFLRTEWVNLSAALESGLEDGDPAAAELVLHLYQALNRRLPTDVLLRMLDEAVQLATGRIRADLLLYRARVWMQRQSVDAAMLDLEEAAGLDATPGMWSFRRAKLYQGQQDFARAIATYRDAAAQLPPLWKQHALVELGYTQMVSGDLDAAESNLRAALAQARVRDAPHIEAIAIGTLAALYTAQDRLDEAVEAYQQALARCMEVDDRVNTARLHVLMGNLHRFEGRTDLAEHHCMEGRRIAQQLGHRVDQALVDANLAQLRIAEERFDEALRLLGTALEGFRACRLPGHVAFVCLGMGRAHAWAGRRREAERWWLRAEPDLAPSARWELAAERCIALARQGDPAGARKVLEAATAPADRLSRATFDLAGGFWRVAAMGQGSPEDDVAHRNVVLEVLAGVSDVRDPTVVHVAGRLRGELGRR
jgi:tetratricopeptide (TPR) repeat protein